MPVKDLQEQWLKDGYAVVRGVFDPRRAERLRMIGDAILEQWRVANPETGQPGGGPDATVMRHLNHPGYFTGHPEWFGDLMDAVADDKVLGIVRAVFGEEPLFRCTSLFFNPTQTSQDGDWHRDTQFTTPNDAAEQAVLAEHGRSGFGMQLQIALVPSADIEYVPESHLRWDTPEEYAIRKVEGGANNRSNAMPGAARLALEPGDAALFNPSGIHRGRYHADKLRRTLMLTYTRTSEPYYDYFSHQPWFMEPDYLGSLRPDTRHFFEPFVQTYAENWRARAEHAAQP
jgi:ectoine hydroxylase-related dioxygenase (phytanoyl-CoA dioxygenase family)